MRNGFLICLRWLSVLSLGLWLGGIVLVGAVGAPAIFRFLRAEGVEPLAPPLFGIILTRFSWVALVCGALALFCWLIEGVLSKPQSLKRRLWWGQGMGVLGMLLIMLYLSFSVLPELISGQTAVIAESQRTGVPLSARGTAGKSAMRLRYDALHRNYGNLTMLILGLGAASLGAFCWRVSQNEELRREN